MKRLVLFICTLLCANVLMADRLVDINGIWYFIPSYGSSTYVRSVSTVIPQIVIPATIDVDGRTYNVTAIGASAFKNKTTFTSISLPNSITYIGDSAFYGCTNLPSIVLPNNLGAINENAFDGCI